MWLSRTTFSSLFHWEGRVKNEFVVLDSPLLFWLWPGLKLHKFYMVLHCHWEDIAEHMLARFKIPN